MNDLEIQDAIEGKPLSEETLIRLQNKRRELLQGWVDTEVSNFINETALLFHEIKRLKKQGIKGEPSQVLSIGMEIQPEPDKGSPSMKNQIDKDLTKIVHFSGDFSQITNMWFAHIRSGADPVVMRNLANNLYRYATLKEIGEVYE